MSQLWVWNLTYDSILGTLLKLFMPRFPHLWNVNYNNCILWDNTCRVLSTMTHSKCSKTVRANIISAIITVNSEELDQHISSIFMELISSINQHISSSNLRLSSCSFVFTKLCFIFVSVWFYILRFPRDEYELADQGFASVFF